MLIKLHKNATTTPAIRAEITRWPSSAEWDETPSAVGASATACRTPATRAADDPSRRMRKAIDSAHGRRLYSERIPTVEPVFASIRHHRRISRFALRGQSNVSTQWQLYCLVHSIEKLAKTPLDANMGGNELRQLAIGPH